MNNTRLKIFKKLRSPYRPFLLMVFAAAVCLPAACDSDNILNRKYVATVNGEKIYLEEYQQRLNDQKGRLSPKTFADSLNNQALLEEEILESMITDRIILQRARELNLSVSSTELERKIIDIRKDYGDNFFNLLAQENVQYENWREQIRKEMLFEKLVATDVNAHIRVSEDEAEDYFNDNPGLCKTEARVRAAQIVVRDTQKAEEVKARLEQGEDFATVAKQVSIGPEATRGGDLGLISRQTMPEPLDKTIFNLPAGTISPIVKSAYGYHIFRIKEIKPARARSFADCSEEVIAAIRAKKEDAAFTAWLEGLKIKAVIKKDTHVLRARTQK